MKTSYTLGPWARESDGFIYAGDEAVASPNCSANLDIEEREANARLIAAAPELLEALDAIFNGTGMTGENMDLARAAIKKAKGE